jgi:hypothetical protein
VVKNFLMRAGTFGQFCRGFQAYEVEGPEGVASNPMVQGIVVAYNVLVKVDPGAQG